MNYAPSSIFLYKEDNNTDYMEWHEMIDRELEADCPVFYRGADQEGNGGHAFVIDGRDDNGSYHINWGWEGYLNGYFKLLELIPEEGSDFRFSQGMVTDFHPADTEFVFSPLITKHYQGGNGLIMNRESVRAGDEFFASVSRLSSVVYDETSEGEVAVALVDQDDKIREILATDTYSLEGGYGYQTFIFLKIESRYNANPGDRLALYFRDRQNPDWVPVPGSYRSPSSIPATGYKPEYASVSWDIPDGVDIWSTYYQHQDRALKYSRYYFIFSIDSSIQDIYVTVNGSHLDPDENGWYEINYVDRDEYEIKVYDAAGTDEIMDEADSGFTEIFTVDGIKILTLSGNAGLDNALDRLPRGIYIVKKGVEIRKVAVGL